MADNAPRGVAASSLSRKRGSGRGGIGFGPPDPLRGPKDHNDQPRKPGNGGRSGSILFGCGFFRTTHVYCNYKELHPIDTCRDDLKRPGMVGVALYPQPRPRKPPTFSLKNGKSRPANQTVRGLDCRRKANYFNALAALPALAITVVLAEPHPSCFGTRRGAP